MVKIPLKFMFLTWISNQIECFVGSETSHPSQKKLYAWRHNMPLLPTSWQYLRIHSPGGTFSGMLAIWDISNKLTFDLLTLKVVAESRVTWAASLPILDFLGLSVLESRPMYATDRRQTDRLQTNASLNISALWGRRHNNKNLSSSTRVTNKLRRIGHVPRR